MEQLDSPAKVASNDQLGLVAVDRPVRPCPWCGSATRVESNFGRDWWVQCTNLDACGCTDGRLYGSESEAVRMWNRVPAKFRFAGWFREVTSGMSYRLWEQGGSEPGDGDIALYEA